MNDRIPRENYALVDLDAMAHNVDVLQKTVGDAALIAVLKANAYGLGLDTVYSFLKSVGVSYFAVANLNEALQIKQINPDCQPLILGYILPDRFDEAQQAGVRWTIFSPEYWSQLRESLHTLIRVHVGVNTGFNRIGFQPTEESADFVAQIAQHPLVELEGLFSHLALADEAGDRLQYEKFQQFRQWLAERGVVPAMCHLADSISAARYPWSRLDAVRIGAALFGLRTADAEYDALHLQSTLRLYARVSQIRTVSAGEGISYDAAFVAPRDMTVATLAVGYADGYPRAMFRGGKVLLHGKEAPIVGILCMDQCMVDVSDIADVRAGDVALLYDIDRDSPVSVESISWIADTNKNEIVAGLAARVPRFYRYRREIIK